MARLTIRCRKFRCSGPEEHLLRGVIEARADGVSREIRYQMQYVIVANESTPVDAPQMPLPLCPVCQFSAEDADFTRSSANTCLTGAEATTVLIHPTSGEVSYHLPHPDAPMSQRYVDGGWQRVRFTRGRDVEAFARSQGVVNDMECGNNRGLEKDFEERRRERRAQEDAAHASVRADMRKLRERGIPLKDVSKGW